VAEPLDAGDLDRLAAQREIARLCGILATLEGAIEDALEAAGAAQQRKGDNDAA